jgi:hypothetical protein
VGSIKKKSAVLTPAIDGGILRKDSPLSLERISPAQLSVKKPEGVFPIDIL